MLKLILNVLYQPRRGGIAVAHSSRCGLLLFHPSGVNSINYKSSSASPSVSSSIQFVFENINSKLFQSMVERGVPTAFNDFKTEEAC